jgi:hypothetical protein
LPDRAEPFAGVRAVVATKHEKTALIAPPLAALGLDVRELLIDTDAFGTFSGEIERDGDGASVVVRKAMAGLAVAPDAMYAIASEGSFGPHPAMPWFTVGVEHVAFVGRESPPIIGMHAATSVRAVSRRIESVEAGLEIARGFGFPETGAIVVGAAGEARDPQSLSVKDCTDDAALTAAIEMVLARCGAAYLESDLRAHRNPARRANISLAAADLAARLAAVCPVCERFGFGFTGRDGFLPCEDCGGETERAALDVFTCPWCAHERRAPRADGLVAASAEECGRCNP